jgi:hypothetical protein
MSTSLFATLNFLMFNSEALATEYSPLDFLSDYDNFSANVGFSQENGRYATFHYEFSE